MNLLDPAWLIHLGTGLLLVGYFIRDELKLRAMIIVSSLVFNAYYWLVPKPPLWDSVITGFLMVGVNLWVLFQVMLDRTTFRLSDDEKQLLQAFSTFSPGQFRRMLKVAKWHDCNGEGSAMLTTEGEVCGALFYVLEGDVEVVKSGHRFALSQGRFVGEVAYVHDGRASATTYARPGTRYVEWSVSDLRSLGTRFPDLANALNARLAGELAEKLRSSVQSEAFDTKP